MKTRRHSFADRKFALVAAVKKKTNLPLSALCAIVASLVLPGCSELTPSAQTQHRISEKPAVFNALTPTQQNNVLGGAIERGNTSDMVYLALGKPSRIVTSADGVKAMWVYKEYYSPKASFNTGYNNPNSSQYTPELAGPNTKSVIGVSQIEPYDDVGNPTPGHHEGLPAYLGPASFHGTQGPGPTQSLAVPDMKSNTVYVFFYAGKVAEIKLDGDASDMPTAAANVAATSVPPPQKP